MKIKNLNATPAPNTASITSPTSRLLLNGADLQADRLRRAITQLTNITDAEVEAYIKEGSDGRLRIRFWHPLRAYLPKNKQRIRKTLPKGTSWPAAILETKKLVLLCREELEAAAAPPSAPATPTTRVFVERWWNDYPYCGHRGKPLRPRSIDFYHQVIKDRVLPHFGDLPIDALTSYQLVRKVFIDLQKRGDSQKYISHVRCCLSIILKSAALEGVISHVPALPPVTVENKKKHKPFHTYEQKELVLEAAANEIVRTAMLMSMDCGLRPSELEGLSPSAIDHDAGWVFICQSLSAYTDFAVPALDGRRMPKSPGLAPTKTGESRWVPLSDRVYDAITAHLDLSAPLLFGGISHSALYEAHREAKRRAGVENKVTYYGLRHTFASHLINRGVQETFIQKWMGHESLDSTEIYAHLIPKSQTPIMCMRNLDERALLNMALYNELPRPRGNAVATEMEAV